ncbi:hypothetical protein O9H85_22185 [Paenibacillus filicis]|uniref:Polymer-forming cytoskeletal protein n=1 Tax=Paenibacillus gyeongsangnamensis TaxID=3388067 RepID=A0ABT4QEI0_9BACL|nr:hypothetical protein [Paenibacillus filicis]MCZ8515080.1 hypothetical protein [Paenibacillus filicis]
MKNKSIIFIAFMLCTLLFLTPTHAMAKGIYEHQDTFVPQNQAVDDVVVVGGDATIWGTVNDAVIVVNGNVNLKASAKINGFVVVIGGNVRQEPGAVITGEIIRFSFDNATKNSLLVGGGLVAGTWLLQLAMTIGLIILPVLIVFLSKHHINPFVDRARQAPGHLMYIGFFSILIIFALTVLLIVTIIGIPIAILLLVLAAASFIYGLAAVSLLVGERMKGMIGRPNWIVSLAGSVVLISFMNVPLLGAILFMGIFIFTIGMMTLWIFEKIKTKRLKKT